MELGIEIRIVLVFLFVPGLAVGSGGGRTYARFPARLEDFHAGCEGACDRRSGQYSLSEQCFRLFCCVLLGTNPGTINRILRKTGLSPPLLDAKRAAKRGSRYAVHAQHNTPRAKRKIKQKSNKDTERQQTLENRRNRPHPASQSDVRTALGLC